MKIKFFEFVDVKPGGWSLSPIRFNDHINLFVGASGSGKTRVLNMLFNIASFAASGKRFCNGQWTLHFEHAGKEFTWKYSGRIDDEGVGQVLIEHIWIGSPEMVGEELVSRDEQETKIRGVHAPKLPSSNSVIYALREDDSVKDLHKACAKIMRRNFFGNDLSNAVSLQTVPYNLVKKIQKNPELNNLYGEFLTLNTLLFLLEKFFPHEFETISDQFKRVFPFVESLHTRNAQEQLDLPFHSDTPILIFREKGIKDPIPLSEMSSGMQKVLLILSDVVVGPSDMLYMIDEYENSLGVNAIDFLPPFLIECGLNRQFILTSHHPLLINAIPVGNWFLFHRKGNDIHVKQGSDLAEKFGRSKQQKFVQLLNDPFYSEGVG